MAFLKKFICSLCQQEKRECVSDDRENCQSCETKQRSQKRRLALAALKGLTTEERLEKIEAQLYDLDVESRLSRLEAKFVTY